MVPAMRRSFLAALVIFFFIPYSRAQIANRYDIVIDEVMVDPTPQVGLPNNEWIELKNTSSVALNLQGFRLADGSGQSGPMPSYVLRPDSFVIVCTGSAVTAMSAFGPTISVTSFPSLDNNGEQLSLISPQGRVIHALNYDISWYQNELKKDGGWSLEMIDTKNPCSGFSNWKAGVEPKGGTPGNKNSIDAGNTDNASPKLLKAFAVDNLNITLVFDEPIDSLKGATAVNYSITDGIGVPQSAITLQPVFDKVSLRLSAPLTINKIYTITANGLADCAGNIIGSKNTARVGLSTVADSFDVVINEILFNPKSGGVDYAEIYNRSQKIIDAKQLYIANRNSSNAINNIRQLTTESVLLFPGNFLVISEDPQIVKQQYVTTDPDAFIQIGSMPSFPDDKGVVIILNAQGNIIDELVYSDKWHFALISNSEGVSLERIDYNAASVQNNFHSAATSIGYGTPGYKNSQFRIDQQVQGEITVTPEVFSPDNDGIDDFATINYNFPSPGYVANITIFDALGRPVRYLQKNALSGNRGSYTWDGLGEKQQKLSQGIYIIFTEIFNTEGKKKQFKNTIVLARRM